MCCEINVCTYRPTPFLNEIQIEHYHVSQKWVITRDTPIVQDSLRSRVYI
jgi:hypothetical protein